MANKLDIDSLKKGFVTIKIGILTKEVIDLLGLNRNECSIILWEDRFHYIEKHKSDFKNEEDFYKHISQIPDIIENPDYVGKHPGKNSIEYIKKIDELMIVAVRIKETGNLAFRSAYPLTENQLSEYLNSGTVMKVERNIDKNE
jgi:hypothetical protein